MIKCKFVIIQGSKLLEPHITKTIIRESFGTLFFSTVSSNSCTWAETVWQDNIHNNKTILSLLIKCFYNFNLNTILTKAALMFTRIVMNSAIAPISKYKIRQLFRNTLHSTPQTSIFSHVESTGVCKYCLLLPKGLLFPIGWKTHGCGIHLRICWK